MTTNARDEKWSEWIDWSGGECPLPDGAMHETRFRDGTEAKDDDPGSSYWGDDGDDCDIIAYRYKIKEPESGMHPDLEWLARNVSEWNSEYFPDGCIFIRNDEKGKRRDYCSKLAVTGNDFTCAAGERHTVFHRHEWQAARQQLGLDDNTMTESEEELPAEEWGDKIGGPRKAEAFLNQAAELLAERGKQYDQPGGERSMGKTIGAFNIITGRDLTEAEGWLIMTLLKRVRQYSGQGYHKDSAEDGVTYGALEAEALEAKGATIYVGLGVICQKSTTP